MTHLFPAKRSTKMRAALPPINGLFGLDWRDRQAGSVTVAAGPERSERKSVLPALTPIEGMEDVTDPFDLLSVENRDRLKRELDDMAKARRKAEATSGSMRLS